MGGWGRGEGVDGGHNAHSKLSTRGCPGTAPAPPRCRCLPECSKQLPPPLSLPHPHQPINSPVDSLTCAVRSLVTSFCRLHTPSLWASPS